MTTPSPSSEVRDTMRTVSFGALWRALRYPFVILSFAFIPKLMGDDGYGRYAYFMSIFVILDMASDLGFFQIFGRFVPECRGSGDPAAVRRILHQLLFYGLILTTFASAALFAARLFLPMSGLTSAQLAAMCLLLLLNRLEGTLFVFLYGLNRIALFSAKEALRSALTFASVLAGWTLAGFDGAIGGLIVTELALTALGAFWTREWLFGPADRFRWAVARPWIVFGLSFYAPTLLLGLLQRSGTLWTSDLTGSKSEAGFYDLANQFLLLATTFLGMILSTLVPSLSALHDNAEHDRVDRWQRTAMTYTGAAIVAIFNALVLVAPPVLRLWLGPDFGPVPRNAIVTGLAMPFSMLVYLGLNYALLEKNARAYTGGVALALAVMSGGCLALVPRLGAEGAAWSTVAGYAVLAAVFSWRYGAAFRAALGGFVRTLIAGLALAPVWAWTAWKRPVGLWDGLLICLCTTLAYVGILFALKIFGRADRDRVRWILNLDGHRGGKPDGPPKADA